MQMVALVGLPLYACMSLYAACMGLIALTVLRTCLENWAFFFFFFFL